MDIKKALKLSFIGGVSGGLETLILYILGLTIQTKSLTLDIIMNGLTFTIVGTGLMSSFIFGMPHLKEKKTKLLIGGIIGGFSAGLFFHLGIGQYLGIIILSASIAFVIKISGMPKAFRIFIGGVLGGFGSISLAGFFIISWSRIELSYPILRDQFSVVSMIIHAAIIIYFMNFGMLLAVKKEGR
jgi:hypothetical protein